MSGFELVALKYGGLSLRSLANGETYHPVVGPLNEANELHVGQHRLAERAAAGEPLVVWDIGFGAAANAVAAVAALKPGLGPVELVSFDRSRAPLEFALDHVGALGYLAGYEPVLRELLHAGVVEVRPGFVWRFREADFETDTRLGLAPPQAIFHDPYSPTVNRGMWSLELFSRLRAGAGERCLLSTYTRSTAVRVSLLLAGFYVGAGRAVGEKDETTLAATSLDMLERPLRRDWFKRVKVSRNGAAIRGLDSSDCPIGEADWAALQAHPQFS